MMDIKKHLDAGTVSTLKSTVPFLADRGTDITGLFYQKMFAAHPELKNIFSMAHQENGEQQQALARAVYGFAAHLDDLDGMKDQISRIAHKHSSLGIQPDQYSIVGKYLLEAIHQTVSEKLDSASADTIVEAWGKGYWVLADMLIDHEKALYASNAAQSGGWEGLREFVLLGREDESDGITSFYIGPVDGKPLPTYHPGQYISLYIRPENAEYQQIRQYSLSDAHSDDFYRITVKREGYISRHMHDNWKNGEHVMVTPPAGDFRLQDSSDTPVVLLSAGVGVTPMVSVMKTVLAKNGNQKITFVHAVKNSKLHPFKAFVEQASEKHAGRLDKIVFYETPLETDRPDRDYQYRGFVDLDEIRSGIHQERADYYLCGPVPFMAAVHKKLTSWGVGTGNIHYEVFGADKALY